MPAKRKTKQKPRSRRAASVPRTGRSQRQKSLSSDERSLLSSAQKVAERLRVDLLRVVDHLPETARSMSGMARHLGVDRNLAQRVLLVAKATAPGPELLEKSPGIDALNAFARSLKSKGARKESLVSLEQAIAAFEVLIEQAGRSHAALARRIRQARRSEWSHLSCDSTFDRDLRESMHRNAAEWCGESTDCALHVFFANLSPDDRTRIDVAMVNGLIGYTARPPAPPLTIMADASGNGKFETMHRTPLLPRGSQTVLWPFTTRPLGVITHNASPRGLLTVIDPAIASQGRKVDYVTGIRPVSSEPNTFLVPPYDHDNTMRVRRPARHLLMDVFMHRDLIARARPGVGTFFPGLQWPMPRENWWSHSLPQHARLELIGENLGPIRTEAYPRHEELVRSMFESLEWPAAEFIGHRLSVPFPVWGTDYRIWFDAEADPGNPERKLGGLRHRS